MLTQRNIFVGTFLQSNLPTAARAVLNWIRKSRMVKRNKRIMMIVRMMWMIRTIMALMMILRMTGDK